jgi:hypothetical protein
VPRRLDCTSDATLAGSYNTRLVLRLALAHAAALFGFAAVFLTGNTAMYLLALISTAVRDRSFSPSGSAIQNRPDRLGAPPSRDSAPQAFGASQRLSWARCRTSVRHSLRDRSSARAICTGGDADEDRMAVLPWRVVASDRLCNVVSGCTPS